MSGRGAGERADRTVPERIADALDYDIAAQRLPIGERLVEVQLADRFGAGRGSVRDALRILAQKGSIQLKPGRGAVVCGYSLEQVADSFAVGAMLIALGARYVAHHRGKPELAKIGERLGRVEAMANRGFSDPLQFATAIGGFTAAIVVGSRNSYVRSQFSAVLNRSVWRAMWEHPCDHLTWERQQEEAAQIASIHGRMAAGDLDGAERETRAFNQQHGDLVLAEMARQRGERAPASPPLAMSAGEAPASGAIERRLGEIERELKSLNQAISGEARPRAGWLLNNG